MENTYVKLPIVKRIEVRGYGLFKKDWEYTFKEGLNLFVGGNRLGKTTTVYIILYGIVGLPPASKNFFSDRVARESQKEGVRPTVRLDFNIGADHIGIERDLFDSHIRNLSINGEDYKAGDVSDIEDIYSRQILRLAGISSLDDYRFLLEKLLIREEEGNYLLWRPDDQMRVLRLLFNYGKFDQEFRKLRNNVRILDTRVRGQQDIQAQFKKRLNAIRAQKLESVSKVGELDLEGLKKRLELLQMETGTLRSSYEKLIGSIEAMENAMRQITQVVHGLNNEIEELDSEIMKIENAFFESVYADPKIQLADHKLKHYQICIFCNQKIPQDKAESIVIDIEDRRRCPVCNSYFERVGRQDIGESDRKKLIDVLLKKKEAAEEKKQELSSKQRDLDSLRERLHDLWEKERTMKAELERKTLEIDDIRLKLSRPEMESMEEIAVYDRDIRGLQVQIDHYQGIIDKAKIDRRKALEKLERKNIEFSQRLATIRADLSRIFKNYADVFLGESELVVRKRRTDESVIPSDLFVPKFDGSERTSILQVSKSEATFLEYAFRLSLCELFKQVTGNEALLVIETSEGLFDIGNAPILADAISRFYDVSYLLIISNLGRPDFLRALVQKTKQDISDRVLNYFEIGKLSEVQERDRDRFNKELRKILI